MSTWEQRRRSTPTNDERQSRTVPSTATMMMTTSVIERKAGGEGGEGGGGEGGGADGGGGCGGGEGGGGEGAMMTAEEMPEGNEMPVTATPKAAVAIAGLTRSSARTRMVCPAAWTVPVLMTVLTWSVPDGMAAGAEGAPLPSEMTGGDSTVTPR
jgi:hypothetical protein